MRRSLSGYFRNSLPTRIRRRSSWVGGKELISDSLAIHNSGDKDLMNLLGSPVPPISLIPIALVCPEIEKPHHSYP